MIGILLSHEINIFYHIIACQQWYYDTINPHNPLSVTDGSERVCIYCCWHEKQPFSYLLHSHVEFKLHILTHKFHLHIALRPMTAYAK